MLPPSSVCLSICLLAGSTLSSSLSSFHHYLSSCLSLSTVELRVFQRVRARVLHHRATIISTCVDSDTQKFALICTSVVLLSTWPCSSFLSISSQHQNTTTFFRLGHLRPINIVFLSVLWSRHMNIRKSSIHLSTASTLHSGPTPDLCTNCLGIFREWESTPCCIKTTTLIAVATNFVDDIASRFLLWSFSLYTHTLTHTNNHIPGNQFWPSPLEHRLNPSFNLCVDHFDRVHTPFAAFIFVSSSFFVTSVSSFFPMCPSSFSSSSFAQVNVHMCVFFVRVFNSRRLSTRSACMCCTCSDNTQNMWNNRFGVAPTTCPPTLQHVFDSFRQGSYTHTKRGLTLSKDFVADLDKRWIDACLSSCLSHTPEVEFWSSFEMFPIWRGNLATCST